MGRSYPQQGVMSAYQLMPHTHAGIGQGGIIRNDDLFQGCGLRVYRNVPQGINDVVITKILFETEMYDIGNDFDADGVDSEFLTPRPGFYYIQSFQTINFTNADKQVFLYIYKDGVALIESFQQNCIAGNFSCSIGALVELAIGEVIDIRIWHNSGIIQNIIGGATTNYLSIFKIGE